MLGPVHHADLFAELRFELKAYLEAEQIESIYQAYVFAAKAHQGQERCSGESYITHPLEVARILAKMRLDPQSIMAALLHDVLEDTETDKATLAKKFGESVAELVDGLTKLTQIKFNSTAEAQAENFRKMVLAMVKDIRVILVKLADRLHNMRTLHFLSPQKQQRIARETLEIHAPIANRLGMHNFCIEFEDLGFAALYPMRYRVLKDRVKQLRSHRKATVSDIKNTLKTCLEQAHLTPAKILGRKKHFYSIYRKMRNKRLSFAEIMDVYGFRIVVDSVDTCYRVLGIVHNLYKPVPERFKDYIAIPKANGYQALHTTLFGPYGMPIEIQIRTQEMEQVAEKGIAAHWLYKTDTSEEYGDNQTLTRDWLQDLFEMQQSTVNSLEFIENVKTDLFPDKVYVFTPKGEIIKMPSGATAIDFAYAVHSDVGNSCVAVRINRRLAPLSTPLANGQTIEILTTPGAAPHLGWLDFAVTGKARSNIRHYLKSQHQAESIALGKRLLQQALNNLSCSLEDIPEKNLNSLLNSIQLKTLQDMWEAVGTGEQIPMVLARRLVGLIKEKNEAQSIDKFSHGVKPLLIKGSEGVVVQFAKCCRPIPRDSIVAIFNKGQGLVVHIAQCRVIKKYQGHSDICSDAYWAAHTEGDFLVDIHIEVVNQQGVLAAIALAVANATANIDDIRVIEHIGRHSRVALTLSVHDRIHLAKVMRKLRTNKAITKLTRYYK